MAGIKNILKLSAVAMILPGIAFGVQAQNPRGSNASSGRNSSYVQEVNANASIRRSATSVIARTAAANSKRRTVVNSRAAAVQRSVDSVRSARSGSNVISGGANVSRAAASNAVKKTGKPITYSHANKVSEKNTSRANKARATAVFNDVSKIGGGYATCRDSYATCMDQFCAAANETYRRCFCSDRFRDFRDTEEALDGALQMLADFQNNNLDAVNKSAAEVNAMYTATEGEAAIKRDTSASQKLLDNISDMLSGKKKSSKSTSSSGSSMGVLDLSGLSGGLDNVWGGGDVFGGGSSLFGDNKNSTNLSEMEGKELFTSASDQCSQITRDACNSDAMFNLARSSYSILVTQDCNLYEKNINAKKSSVEETVRQAEKYLREARLEEYRSHNSADVNQCLAKVEEALKGPMACGPKYEKCMDYTGKYINTTTGEPIYSKALFGLNNLIVLGDSADVLGANKEFNAFLDERKIYAETALNSCRDISDTVWYEFKRSALIQIAQAQDEKIESVKDSCVETIKECYDEQTGMMESLDTTVKEDEQSSTKAIAAVAARGMCYERVMACAALYGDPDGCSYDDRSKKLVPVSGKVCGLQSLLAFVDTVDSVKVAEGCEVALTKYLGTLCPDEEIKNEETGEVEQVIKYAGCKDKNKQELRASLESRIKMFCATDLVQNDQSNTIGSGEVSAFNLEIRDRIIKDVFSELGIGFSVGCEDMGGVWMNAGDMKSINSEDLAPKFYKKYYGISILNASSVASLNLEDVGYCVSGNLKTQCLAQNEGMSEVMAEFDEALNQCSLTTAWYESRCEMLGGTYYNQQCEIQNVRSPNEK